MQPLPTTESAYPMLLPHQHTRILRGKDILAAFLYEFGLAAINYLVFIISVLGTLYVYTTTGTVPTSSDGKILGAVAATSAAMFGLTATGMFLLDILRGKNHFKNIMNSRAYNLTKTYDLDYSILVTALMRATGAISLCNLLGDVFGNYVFSLSDTEFTAFSLIMAKAPWATATIGAIVGLPASIIYAHSDSRYNRQNRRIYDLIRTANNLLVPFETTTVTPSISIVDAPVLPSAAVTTINSSCLPYHNYQSNFRVDNRTPIVPIIPLIAHQQHPFGPPEFYQPNLSARQ